ncbi:MAG: hypothetical protein M0008_12845 [Actinomycetota bacterium]|nr:hypothetical protein [Actinomycetota bacterium]
MHYKKISALYSIAMLYVLFLSLRGLLVKRAAIRTVATAIRLAPAAGASKDTASRWKLDQSGEGVISAAMAARRASWRQGRRHRAERRWRSTL